MKVIWQRSQDENDMLRHRFTTFFYHLTVSDMSQVHTAAEGTL